jgi:hypothetical protein
MKGCRRIDAKVLGIDCHRKFTRGVREMNQPSRNCGVPASRASMISRPFATQVAPWLESMGEVLGTDPTQHMSRTGPPGSR